MSEYYAGDGLPLNIGDVVTLCDTADVSNKYWVSFLIRGVVVEEAFGHVDAYGEVLCKVRFDVAKEEYYELSYRRDDGQMCAMKKLAHVNAPMFEKDSFMKMLGLEVYE